MKEIKRLFEAGKFERAVLRADALDKDGWNSSQWLDFHRMIRHSCFQLHLSPGRLIIEFP